MREYHVEGWSVTRLGKTRLVWSVRNEDGTLLETFDIPEEDALLLAASPKLLRALEHLEAEAWRVSQKYGDRYLDAAIKNARVALRRATVQA